MKSVVSQTYLPEKIIIVDDGSADKTVDIVKYFKKNSNVGIELHRQENRGPNAARNAGLKHSTSEFVAFLDADDIWESTKLEKQFEVFEKSEFKNPGIVYCGYDLLRESGSATTKKIIRPALQGNVFLDLLKSNTISGSCSAVLVKKECFERAGLFDETLSGSEDWDMWLRLSEFYEFDYVPEPLVFITDRTESNNKNYERMLENRIKFLNKWMDEIRKDRELVIFHRNKIIMLAIRCKTKDFSFKMVENIEKTMNDSTKAILFGDVRINLFKFIPAAIFNYFREKMF